MFSRGGSLLLPSSIHADARCVDDVIVSQADPSAGGNGTDDPPRTRFLNLLSSSAGTGAAASGGVVAAAVGGRGTVAALVEELVLFGCVNNIGDERRQIGTGYVCAYSMLAAHTVHLTRASIVRVVAPV